LVMHAAGMSRGNAEKALKAAKGNVRGAIAEPRR
jgi:hypothetical protein